MGKQMFTILITSFCRTKSCGVKESLYLTAGRQISQQSTNFRQEVRTIHYVQLGSSSEDESDWENFENTENIQYISQWIFRI